MFREPISHRIFIERLVIGLVVIAIALLLWNLRGLLLLVFGAVLVSIILGLVADPIQSRLGLPRSIALTCAVLICLGILLGASWLFGFEIMRQADALRELIPSAWEAMLDQLDQWGVGEPVREWIDLLGEGGGVVSSLGSLAMSLGNALADTLLVIVGGIYLAAQPNLYWTGMIKLVPERGRAMAAQAMEASGRALRLWLLGRMVSMATVGLLVWIGLVIIGVPSAMTLGLLAALLEFVPFIGPIVSAIPAVILAFAVGPDRALWTIMLFLVIQQIEGNVLEPLVQQQAVDLPPALLLFALVAFGLMFGIVGLLLAAPLTVVAYVLVKKLYVQATLHTETPLPGEEN